MSAVSRKLGQVVIAAAVAAATPLALAQARPITTKESVLPSGTDFNDEQLDQPTELFTSQKDGGSRTYQQILGDILFSSPAIFGGPAQKAGMSCNSCHQQGAGNTKLFVPGHSVKPGTFDTTGPLFNPSADNHKFDPVTVPSLRGEKHLGPFGHDGRFATLRDFVHNVIVNEFAGAEPSKDVLDALVAYVEDISFLPNEKLTADGRLTSRASDAARRGEVVFNRPFRKDASLSCAVCHQPKAAFVDHQLHDVGSDGAFKTKTLLNANFSAPYFHDGRYDTYGQVVDHFDRHFDLGLSEQDRSDLIAYLDAVGDADEPVTRNTVQAELDELTQFASVFETAIAEHKTDIIALAVDAIGDEWRELGESFPSPKNPTIRDGLKERVRAHEAVRGLVLTLRRIAMAAQAGNFDDAARIYGEYRRAAVAAAGTLRAAEAYSLFNPQVRDAHFRALDQLVNLARVPESTKR